MSAREIDFSCKHNVLIQDEDGVCLPVDVPYFESEYIAPGTWRIRTDGDAIYLVEGEREAIVIDSGYGVGNLRMYCQTLTQKPVHCIVNTHDHFDHTANNAYFEKAYMTEATRPLATIPFPSFAGIDFPRDYPVELVRDGDKIDLGGRTLEVLEIPDHAVGSIALLDSREGILFSGDEITASFKLINTSVENVLGQMRKLQSCKGEFDRICPGPGGPCGPEVIDQYAETLEYLLRGGKGAPGMGFLPRRPQPPSQGGPIVYDRFRARPCDMKIDQTPRRLNHADLFGVLVIYPA
ncbi:MAG: MBL fold metallo-hydrolase [Clostridiales bacterium]|nr:MBL fold metallo-hydrolase [Clostridiales bacterium]